MKKELTRFNPDNTMERVSATIVFNHDFDGVGDQEAIYHKCGQVLKEASYFCSGDDLEEDTLP